MAPTESHDLVVVGAGLAGSLLAARVAARGMKVLLLEAADADPEGDGMPEWANLADFAAAGLPEPGGDGVRSQDLPIAFVGDTPDAFVSCRRARLAQVLYAPLVRRLRAEARAAGAELRMDSKVSKTVDEQGRVVGVEVRKAGEARARLVADCSGFDAVLRRRLYGCGLKPMSGKLRPEDQLSERHLLLRWERPSGGASPVNVAFGAAGPGSHVAWQTDGQRREVLAVLAGPLDDMEALARAEAALRARVDGVGEVLARWDGVVGHRRPLDSLVTDGMLAAGDSACQGHPILGWSIGGALRGGAAAAETAIRALETGRTLKADLWDYNARWQRSHGAMAAARHMDRIFLAGCSQGDLSALIAAGAISSGATTSGNLIAPRKTVKVLPRLAGHRALLVRYATGAGLPAAARSLYRFFPADQDHFSYDRWQERVIDLNHWAEEKLARSYFQADDGF